MLENVQALVAAIPDYPLKGILFRDITPVLADHGAFTAVVEDMAARLARLPGGKPDAIAGIESRGFILGAPLALRLGVGFLTIRKPGKLPRKTVRAEYAKEYGTDALEMHADAVKPGMRVAVVDDLLATGGTAEAASRLVEVQGGVVCALAFLIELDALHGRRRLKPGAPVEVLLHY
jgi:adenine phosphoribosyltransferase